MEMQFCKSRPPDICICICKQKETRDKKSFFPDLHSLHFFFFSKCWFSFCTLVDAANQPRSWPPRVSCVHTGRPDSSSPSWMNCRRGAEVFSRSQRSASGGCPSSSCPAVTPTPRPSDWTGPTRARTCTRPVTSRCSPSCTTTTVNLKSCEAASGDPAQTNKQVPALKLSN